jgi:hypothetical protein
MIQHKFITAIVAMCLWLAASSLNAATIPAGTMLAVQTLSSITSTDPVGRTFTAKLDQDIAVRGNVLLKAGTKAFGKVVSSRANPRRSDPLTLELTSISLNGRDLRIRTDTFQPGSPARTGRQARHGHTAGTLLLNPATKIQFTLAQPVTF